jgi:ABC-type sugar transport system substrate-binding protein
MAVLQSEADRIKAMQDRIKMILSGSASPPPPVVMATNTTGVVEGANIGGHYVEPKYVNELHKKAKTGVMPTNNAHVGAWQWLRENVYNSPTVQTNLNGQIDQGVLAALLQKNKQGYSPSTDINPIWGNSGVMAVGAMLIALFLFKK